MENGKLQFQEGDNVTKARYIINAAGKFFKLRWLKPIAKKA
jgi:hypothetical protein